jgi:hypothetical protein
MGFRSLQHIQGFEVHIHASLKLLAKFRLQGLFTLLTAYSLESRAGFVSHRLRSWDSPLRRFILPQGITAFPRRRTHLLLAPPFLPTAHHRTGLRSLNYWVRALPELPFGQTTV